MSSPLTVTSVAHGRYQIRQLLGEGSRKRVYRAHDTRLDRDVALALIKTEGLDAAGLARVRREAQAMGRLGDHPHIVTVHDVGEERGQPYIVSQYMAGGSVEDLLKGSRDREIEGSSRESGPRSLAPLISRSLPVEEVLRLGDHVCRALEHAHGHEVIHRDLKPANVWLTADGTAKLGDFGLALARDRSRVTVEGMMVGTVAYMAPEQALGKAVDARSDLYALGALLYEMVTARPPFVADDAIAVISQHLHTAPVAPSWHNAAVATGLERLILQLLEKEPAKRPASAGTVREVLNTVATGGTGPRARPSTAHEEGRPQEAAPAHDSALAAPPNPLDRLDAGVFVGREKELKAARATVEAALGGLGHIVLLAGEPGIGKTRMAQELATYAQLRAMQVLWGRGHDGGGAPA